MNKWLVLLRAPKPKRVSAFSGGNRVVFGALSVAFCFLFCLANLVFAGKRAFKKPDAESHYIIAGLKNVEDVHALAFSPDGSLLVSGGNEEDNDRFIVTCWDVAKRRVHTRIKSGNQVQIHHLLFSPSGKTFAVGDMDGEVHVFTTKGKKVNQFRVFLNSATGIFSLAFLNEEELFSVAWHSIAQQWNVNTNRTSTYRFDSATGVIYAAAITSDKKLFLWCDAVSVNFAADKLTHHLGAVRLPLGHGIERLCISDNQSRALATAYGGILYLFDTKRQRLLKKWKGHGLKGEFVIFSVLPLPQNKGFVTADREGNIKFWTQEGRLITQVKKYRAPVTALAATRDGSILATAGQDQRIVLWDLRAILRSGKGMKPKGRKGKPNIGKKGDDSQ